MIINFIAICNSTCGTNKQCSAPDTCTCVNGWTGSDCLTGFFIKKYEMISICDNQCDTNMKFINNRYQ